MYLYYCEDCSFLGKSANKKLGSKCSKCGKELVLLPCMYNEWSLLDEEGKRSVLESVENNGRGVRPYFSFEKQNWLSESWTVTENGIIYGTKERFAYDEIDYVEAKKLLRQGQFCLYLKNKTMRILPYYPKRDEEAHKAAEYVNQRIKNIAVRLGGQQDGSGQVNGEKVGIPEYVVFDLETTGTSVYYSEPVQISAIKVRNGQIVDKFDTLVKPTKESSQEAIAVNHITNEMLVDAPRFRDVYPLFENFIGDSILIGYNIRKFDLPLLNTRVSLMKNVELNVKYIDVYHEVYCLDGLCDRKLTTVARNLGIDPEGAHNALTDCTITNEVYKALLNRGVRFQIMDYQGQPFTYRGTISNESIAINVLKSILNTIIEDKAVSEDELFELCEWVKENADLSGTYPFDNISKTLQDILEDGVVEKTELDNLELLIEKWLDPVSSCECASIESILGRHIVLTGDFEYDDKDIVAEYIRNKGGIVDNNVTKKTDYVVVGAYGSSAWAAGNYGTKIKKALEYNEKGMDIKIVKEKEFFQNLESM